MMCASVLGLEAVVLGLVTPVLITVEDMDTWLAIFIGVGLAVSALLVAGLLRFEWAYAVGFAIQVAALALGFVVPVMFVLGLIFGALWVTAYVLGRKIEHQQAAYADAEQSGRTNS
jgi:hypothetical protein